MRLISFTVEGFKNLTAPVTFGPLGEINVIHGPNNVGKSNLLGAIELFFRALGIGNHVSKDQHVSLDASEQIEGYPFAEIFHAINPVPIRWQVTLSLPAEELREVGVEPECPTDPCKIGLELTPVPSGAQLRVTQFAMGNIDVASTPNSSHAGFAESLRAFIAGTFFVQTDHSVRPFRLVDPYRDGGRETPAAATARPAGLVTQRVRDDLFDARQSLDRELRSRWALFARLMQEMKAELGPGAFETAFDRSTGRANLVFESGESAMGIDRLGRGVQRMVAVLGSLALARATMAGFEEPELGLSPSLQQRFLRAARGLLAAPSGPSQLFYTTHSPILGGGESSFAMELVDGVPVLEQRALEGGSVPLAGEANAEDLDGLIGLVDQLAELEPAKLVASGSKSK